jgi:hypothetical protein
LVIPPDAIYRRYPLPPDLFETWIILRGLSWVNKYLMTPPASLSELLEFHHALKLRALEYRLERLERTGWLTVNRSSGKVNVYATTVPPDNPPDKPIDYAVQAAVHGGEPTSLRGISPEESARCAPGSEIGAGFDVSHNTPATDCTSFSSTVVVGTNFLQHDEKNLYQQQQSTATPATDCRGVENSRSSAETEQIVNALWDLDIRDDAAVDAILGKIPEMFRGCPRDFSHVTPEYVEDWVLHRRLTAKKGGRDLLGDGAQFEYALGGGYYRMQIREKRASTYRMSDRQRAEYRARWGAASAADEDEIGRDPLDQSEPVAGESARASAVEPTAPPSPYRADGTADLWEHTLGELKLQMTKATFDTWVAPSRALGWDDTNGDLVVQVHSQYAKVWLETRLHTTVLRTVSGIAERAVAIRYEVA